MMHRLKWISILALIICLNVGCQTVDIPEREDHERCIVFIAPLDGSKCRCHTYRISPDEVGRVSESYDKPLIYCNKLVGFLPPVWVDTVLWVEEVFEAVEDANSDDVNSTPIAWPRVETKREIEMMTQP